MGEGSVFSDSGPLPSNLALFLVQIIIILCMTRFTVFLLRPLRQPVSQR